MRKKVLTMLLGAFCTVAAWGGGLMTNTNYHIAFDRMFARGATTEIDGVFSNPAGLAWGHEGWQLSLNFQKPWQNRDIETTVDGQTQKFLGKASAPIVPALFASYKHDRWALSAMIGIVGSGGFVEYNDGVPMFNIPMTKMITGQLASQFMELGMPVEMARQTAAKSFGLNSQMKGKQYIYGGQLNFTYRLLDCLSAAVGLRANYYDGYYRGHVTALTTQALGEAIPAGTPLADMRLSVDQRGWGFTPIVGVDYHQGPLMLAARYEFRTKISVPNDTKELAVNIGGKATDIVAIAAQLGTEKTVAALGAQLGSTASKISAYLPDERTRYDMPSLLTVAAGYEFSPQVRASVEYHFFDDKNAKMANDRQKELKHGTHEVLAGVEWDINKKFTVSCGGQRTDYGLSDNYQQNTSFACDSWSVGLGGAVNLTDQLRLNVSYFCTLYGNYEKTATAVRDGYDGRDVYSRTNHVIGVGIDYKF